MLTKFAAVATIAVKDIRVATDFYEQTLGLVTTASSLLRDWSQRLRRRLTCGGTMSSSGQ